MPRRSRFVCEGLPHHITQRGNYRQNVFESREDFQTYCYLFTQYSQKYKVEIVAYCLMNNHVHFVVVPSAADGLARLFNTTHMRYSQYKNLLKHKKGHLWQGRFFSSVMDETYLIFAVRYVERNPVRARMVKNAWDYVWSSARQHVNLERDPILKTTGRQRILQLLGKNSDWRTYLGKEDKVMLETIRTNTSKGLVIGSDNFIEMLEQKTGMVLKEGKPGRPKTKK